MLKRTLPFALLACLGAASYAAAPEVGKPIPAFSMTSIAGKKMTNASLKGKVVLLDFWATWCGPCKAASPTVQALHKKYAGKGLVAIGANTFEESIDKKFAAGYAKEHSYNYTFTFGNDKLANSWGVTGIPFFVLIDQKGVVRWIGRGFNPQSTPAEVEGEIKKLIK